MSNDSNQRDPIQPSESGPSSAIAPPRLRLWPGIVLVAALWLARGWVTFTEFATHKFLLGMVTVPLAVVVGLLLWWLFASRLRRSDRWLVVGAWAAFLAVTWLLADASFRGLALVLYAAPWVATLWVGWLAISWRLSWPVRRAGILLVFALLSVDCLLLRVDGVTGNIIAKLSWRWTSTPEQQYLAELHSKAATPETTPSRPASSEQSDDWPGFRGLQRDGRLSGVRIRTDWQQSPPRQLWRHRIGPGWSSLAVVGERVFTQEQRGDSEYVVCYDATNGDEMWAHRDATRFSELAAGPGPRATPTFHAGRLYAYGASSQLNCLHAASGKVLWSHDVAGEFKANDAEKEVPQWGFASSPLVTQGVVVVFAGARDGKTVVAYQADSGKLAWTASVGPKPEKVALSYSSPQLAVLDGVPQILLATNAGLSAFEPATGQELWHYAWPSASTARITQPALLDQDDLILGTGQGYGTRRIHVQHGAAGWSVDQRWATRKIKPYFNDWVVFQGYSFGFDADKLVCLDAKDGAQCWRASGYGSGQLLLLADQGLLLVLSEEGEVALLSANPEKQEELCRFKALEGKTWNHPVIAHGRLLVRNAEEIACYALPER